MPKVEDGNNFGVEVQEQCIAQLKQFEIESLMLFEEEVISKIWKKYLNAKIYLGSVSLGARNDHLKNQPDFRNPRLQALYDSILYIYESDERRCRKLQESAYKPPVKKT